MGRLDGRVAIVTGAAAGLGKAMAIRFAQEGARIALADCNDADAVAKEIAAGGGQAIALRTDVSDARQVDAMVKATLNRFDAVDILVNNAGIASGFAPRPFEQISAEEWRRILDVNVIGTMLPCAAVAPIMRNNGYGRILNFSSNTAVRGATGMMHYVASKGAVQAMSMALANELGRDGISVNTIAPGYILTENNLGNVAMAASIREAAVARRAIPREGLPEDVVETALFFVSEGAGFISGQLITINGGQA